MAGKVLSHCLSVSKNCTFCSNTNMYHVTISSQPVFAFLYKEQFPVDGWKVYDPIAEYRRQVSAYKL